MENRHSPGKSSINERHKRRSKGLNGLSGNRKNLVVDKSNSAKTNSSQPFSSNNQQSDQIAENSDSSRATEISHNGNSVSRSSTKDNIQPDRASSRARNFAPTQGPGSKIKENGENSDKQLAITDRKNLFPNKSDCGDILCSISSDEVELFRKSTYFWFYSKTPPLSPVGKGPIQTTSEKPSEPCALYYVISFNKSKEARLQAITVDLWLNRRGDLHEIVLTEEATNTLKGRRYNPRKTLKIGDVIFVQRVSPTSFSEGHSWESVTETDPKEREIPDYEHRWKVDEYQVFERRMHTNRLAVVVEEKYAKEDDGYATSLLLAVEGVADLVETSALDLKRKYRKLDTLLVGTVFVPPPRAAVFSFNLPDQYTRQLLEQRYHKEKRHRPIRPTFLSPRLATEDERNCLFEWRNSIYKEKSLDSATEWIHRRFALSVPGLSALERSKVDTNSHIAKLKIPEKGEDFLRLCFETEGGNWSSGQCIVIKMASGKHCFGRVTYVENCTVHAKAAGIHALTINRSFSDIVVVRQVSQRIRCSEEEFYCGEERLDISPDHRFHEAFISAFGGPVHSLEPSEIAWNNPRRIQYQGREITFFPEQMEVLNAVINSDSAVVVSAGFGCGKTLLANAILARLAKKIPDKAHAIVVQCNFAVVSAVNCAADLDEYSDQRIVRLISPINMGLQEERTDYDLPILMRAVFKNLKVGPDISDEDVSFAKEYLEEIGENNGFWDKMGKSEEKDHEQKTSEYCQAVRIFFKAYKPQRIFSTTSSLFSFIHNMGYEEKLKEIVDTLIVDEASQLSEDTFALLAHRLPGARPILIGDPKQLEPFAPFTDCDLLQKMAIGNLLERLEKEKKWPLFNLEKVFRCHPEITRILSEVFYENRLQTEAKPRSDLLKRVNLKNEEYPILILNPRGHQEYKETSLFNEIEAKAAINIAKLLIQFVSSPSDIAIICMYKAQAERIASRFRCFGVFIGTVDSCQGREFRATIVCTTRTRKPTKSKGKTPFFTNPKRILVALSRATEFLIILGATYLIKKTPYWKRIFDHIGDNYSDNADDFLHWNGGVVSSKDE